MRKVPVRPPFHRFTWKWMLLLSILTAGVIWAMVTASQPVAHISFSKFVEQVRVGNVEQVEITNEEIAGRFATPIQWANDSNMSNASVDAIYPVGTFTNFRVELPRSLGVSSLDSLFEEYDVTLSPASAPTPWIIELLRSTLPFALLIVTAIWILRQFPFNPQPVLVRVQRE